jgi:Yip1 domain
MMLESIMGIAYAPRVIPTEPIHPLHDVWLRPRRVFRELAARPIGSLDYLLGAAQGVLGALALSRAQNAGATSSLGAIFGRALVLGSIAGVASLFVMGAIYARLGSRGGGTAGRSQVFHVLAYGGIPNVASLGIWLLTAMLAGEATFMQTPRPDVEGFVALLLHVQFVAYLLLMLWTVVLQVMGFSEIQGLPTGKAFGMWFMGQIIGMLAFICLMLVITVLFPNAALN